MFFTKFSFNANWLFIKCLVTYWVFYKVNIMYSYVK
jgi:hypothetical protein